MAARFAIAALAVLQACAAVETDSREAERTLLMEGEAAIASGRREAAVEAFTRAIEAQPRSAEAYYRRGSARLKRVESGELADEAGELAKAIDDLGVALDLHPLHFGALYNRGLALAALSRYREAALDLQQSTQSRDVELRRDAHAKLGTLLEEKFLDLGAQALKHYDSYAELGGRDSEVLARAAALRGRSLSANSEDEAAAAALLQEARALLSEGRKDLAGELLGRVLRRYAKTRGAAEAAPLLKEIEEKR